MNNVEFQKWNYSNVDRFHMLEVAKRLKEFAFSINDISMQKLKESGKNYKFKHFKFKNDNNIYWYGAKIYILSFDGGVIDSGKRNFFTRSPELVTGMFIKLVDTFHYTSENYFYPRLFIYDMAADFVQYYENTRNEELNKNLVKDFFMFFYEYLINSVEDDKIKSEYTKGIGKYSFSIEYDYVGKGEFPQLYFAYGSNMDKIQMDNRCPGAEPLAICKKLNYRTILNTRGVATIIPELGSICYGILWRVTKDHVKALDKYEGVRQGFYKKVNFSVMIDGYQIPCLVYIAADDKIGSSIRPGYLNTLLRGIENFNGHSKWYNEIKQLGYV